MSSIFDEFKNDLEPNEDTITGRDLNISNRVQTEIDAWGGIVETDPEAQERLSAYWSNIGVTGWSPSTPWSGAFISYLLRDQDFPGDGLHSNYVSEVIEGNYPGWTAYNTESINDGTIQVNIGDVLVKRRSGGYVNGHGDLVYAIENGQAKLVGGNLSNGLRTTNLQLLDSNVLGATNYDVILKKGAQKKTNWLLWITAGVVLWTLSKS